MMVSKYFLSWNDAVDFWWSNVSELGFKVSETLRKTLKLQSFYLVFVWGFFGPLGAVENTETTTSDEQCSTKVVVRSLAPCVCMS